MVLERQLNAEAELSIEWTLRELCPNADIGIVLAEYLPMRNAQL
jgi:hypothetical protein